MTLSGFSAVVAALSGGVLLTVWLTTVSAFVGFTVSVPLSLMRVSRRPYISSAVLAYTYCFRGTPLLVQLFLVYYGAGQIVFVRESFLWFLLRDPFWCALINFSLNSAAYTTEILAGGIRAVPKGYIEAARAIGMSDLLIARRVTLPLAFRSILPSYANEVISLLKATSLASTITLLEITGLARKLVSETFAPYQIFVAAGLLYFIMTFVVARLFRQLERSMSGSRQFAKPRENTVSGTSP